MPTAPTPISAYATPPSSDDPVNFDARADAKVADDVAKVGEYNALAANVYANAVEAFGNASISTAKAAEAITYRDASLVNAQSAAASAGAAPWISGTTYAAGAVVWSPVDSRIYRRRAGMGGAGTTDPSLDVTNWMLASGGWWGVPTLLTVANNGQTLASNALYHVDSAGGSFNLLMPVMAVGDWIKLVDVSGNLGLNPVTITRNATNGNLAGYAEDRVLDAAFDSVEMVKTSSYGVIEQ